MHIGLVGQGILGETVFCSQLAQTPAERDACGLGVLVEMIHQGMLDVGCQPVQSGLVGSALVYYVVRQSRLERRMGVPDDAAIAAGVRRWIDYLAQGTREDREELADLVEEAGRGFPAELAIASLAQLDEHALWKSFDDDDLQDFYDIAHAAEMATAAERFKAAALARPYIDAGKVPKEIRELVMERDGRRCQACGETEDLTIDHKITPWSEGGSSTDPDNLQVLCRKHNSSKGTRPWVEPAKSTD